VIPVPNYKPRKDSRRSWAKLFLFDRLEYKKLVYLDTDMIVRGKLDDLFTLPMLSCVDDPDLVQICNTGLMVLEPRAGLRQAMQAVARRPEMVRGPGDQSFFNSYFRKFTSIPTMFNSPRTQTLGLGLYMRNNVTRVIHYTCKKPWKCGREGVDWCGCGYPSLNKEWWRLWDLACQGRVCMEDWLEGENQINMTNTGFPEPWDGKPRKRRH
jgi:glycogenin glucosyltransferase